MKVHKSIFLLPFLCILTIHAEAADSLPNLSVRLQPLTISGFSSGGTFASQMQIAYSKTFRGSAIFAGIWYRCAPYGSNDYRFTCGRGKREVQEGINDAEMYQVEGLIDNLSNLKDQKVYIYIGNDDELVRPNIREMTSIFYKDVGMNPKNIFVKIQDAFHCMPSNDSTELSCRLPGVSLFGFGVGFCHYNGAFESINYLLDNSLVSPDQSSNRKLKLGPLNKFDQTEFLSKEDQKYMDSTGYYYIPSKCKADIKSCRLHIGLHGCLLSRRSINDLFIQRSGYLQVAEVNNIVMLFPQSTPFPGNTEGCWDIFGASNETTYATKDGVQMKAVRKMIEKITGKTFQ